MAVSDYSTTPDENVSISGINIAEGCAPSGINNAIRQMMSDIKTKTASMDSTASANAEAISAEETRAKAAEATYLPLSGGTMTGNLNLGTADLTFTGDQNYKAIKASGSSMGIEILSGTSIASPSISFYTESNTDVPGSFFLRSGNSGEYSLNGTNDGTLKWCGNVVESLILDWSSNGSTWDHRYRRWSSGLQIVEIHDIIDIPSGTSSAGLRLVSFVYPFARLTGASAVNMQSDYANVIINMGPTTSNVTVTARDVVNGGYSPYFRAIIIGSWK